MDVKYLYYFKRVAELEHITKASQELYVSQAQLSRIISEVEAEVGVALFDREGRGIELNESGKVFYQYVLKLIGVYNEGVARTHEAYAKGSYEVSVVTNVGLYMPELMASLSRKAPELRVRQFSAPRKGLISMLKNGNADFAITSPSINEIGISSQVLLLERPVVIYPEGHWLEGTDIVELEKLANERFVGTGQGYGSRDAMVETYLSHQMKLDYIVETGDTSSVPSYVAKGLGIALCPKTAMLQDDYYKNHYTDISEDIPCHVSLSWISESSLNEAETKFAQVVGEFFEGVSQILEERSVASGPSSEDGHPATSS